MKRIVRFLPFVFLTLGATVLLKAQESIPQQIRTDVVYLASDYLEGRATGMQGEELAAAYIADRFQKIGLLPKGGNGSYFQNFTFTETSNPHSAGGGKKIPGKNVIAYINNKAKSTVVIGAHYDHLGYGEFGSRHTGDPAVHNGADDNASGVASLLYLAEKLSKEKKQKNNYLFIAFSGEEMGLHGSKHFVENPTIDLSSVNYMLNMDMVGRLNEEKTLVVNAAGTSPVWKETLNKVKVGGIQIKTSDSGIGPSDHTSFYLKDIPCLHFFTGQHQDYHKPVDDSHLINWQGLFDVSEFIFQLTRELNDDGKIEFTKTKDESEGERTPRFKVTLGVLPDYTYQDGGLRIDGVLDGRTAANAGLEDGDIVIKIGEYDVSDIYSYMEALSKFEAGNETTIVVKRGEETLEKKVKF